MLAREISADHIYLACGHTDMRKSIDGLASIVSSHFKMDPHQPSLFLFCGRRKDRIKALLWTRPASSCCISVWKTVSTNGQASRRISLSFPSSSFAGSQMAYPSISLVPSRKCILPIQSKLQMCITT